ncbi:hypothetical protein EUTSA_v10019657mg, partial [Eutrema salsugineum]
MEPDNVERNLQSLRRLYGLVDSNARDKYVPEAYKLDDNTLFLLKRLLDFATHELFVTQSKILAKLLGLSLPGTDLQPSNVEKSKPSKKDGLTQEIGDAIERIDTQLSALSLFASSRRVESDDRTRSCKSEEGRQSFQPPLSGIRSTYMPMSHKVISVSNDNDQFVQIKSRPPPLLPPPIGVKKPSQSSTISQKMLQSGIMKPTLLDHESETASWRTRTGTSSEYDDEELVSFDQTASSSASNWDSQAESVTDSDSESVSSYPPQSGIDDSEVSSSFPSYGKGKRVRSRDLLKRLTHKVGQVFHHHHHHHHRSNDKDQGHKSLPWKHLQRNFHHKQKEKAVERRQMKSESKGLTKHKQRRDGQFHGLVEQMMRHRRRHSKKKNLKLQSHGKKSHWWETLKKRQRRGVKFPNTGR